MPKYRFCFLTGLGEIAGERVMDIPDDAEAMEIARLFDHPFAIRILQDEREVATVRLEGKNKS